MAGYEASRRSFVGRLLGGTVAAGALGVLGAIIAYLSPSRAVSSALGPRRVRVCSEGEMRAGQGRLMLVNEEPVWVVRVAKGFVAVSAWCTHKGCTVTWDEHARLFRCPCHEGLFDERGNVVAGLPLRPLRRFRVGSVHGGVYVSPAGGGEA